MCDDSLVYQYADDLQLYCHLTLTKQALAEAVNHIEKCVDELKDWMTANLLSMNDSKTQFLPILTTNLAAVVCVRVCVCVCVDVCQCAKFDQFLPARSHFESKRPEKKFRIAKFPYAAFGPLFAFHCPLFFTRNNDLEWKSSRFAAVVRRSVADKQLA